jgi:hypothetical protein
MEPLASPVGNVYRILQDIRDNPIRKRYMESACSMVPSPALSDAFDSYEIRVFIDFFRLFGLK